RGRSRLAGRHRQGQSSSGEAAPGPDLPKESSVMTTVTRDVIRDLLPVYVAGEASADTKRLVEEFLAADQELRSLAHAATEIQIPTAPLPTELQARELKALDQTRSMLTRKMWLFAISLFFSLLPMAFAFDENRITFLM